MAEKKSFVVYSQWATIIANLPDEQAAMLSKAICCKHLGIEYEITDPTIKAVFLPIEQRLDADSESYEKTCEARARAGSKGGIASASERISKSKQIEAKASKSKQIEAKASKSKQIGGDNEYENENENENDNENESPTGTISPSETTSPSGQEKHIARNARTRAQKSPAEQKHKRGEFGHVMLTDAEYTRLCDEKGKDETDDAIRVVDEYAETSGKRYKNYSLAIQRWGYRAAAEQAAKEWRAQIRPAGGFSAADYFARVARGEEAL